MLGDGCKHLIIVSYQVTELDRGETGASVSINFGEQHPK